MSTNGMKNRYPVYKFGHPEGRYYGGVTDVP